jgi:hypothetical protein
VSRSLVGLFLSFTSAAVVPAIALVPACASKHGTVDGPQMDASQITPLVFDAGHLEAPEHPDASCEVTIDTPPTLPGTHVPIGSHIDWSSNPPSSGPHYPIWAAYKEYKTPVDLGYLVHDLEHGAILFLYRCDDPAGCPAVAAALVQAAAAIPDDPLCAAQTAGAVRVRAVIAPDPLLDVPVAAASWGWTYKAACVDLPTLVDFARAHYGNSPEKICADGQQQF